MKRAFFLCLPLLAAVCGSSDDNTLPTFVKGTIAKTTYDGTTNDLLTGGLGKTGLGSATPPTIATPASPAAAELRTLAIYRNYQALVDITALNCWPEIFTLERSRG